MDVPFVDLGRVGRFTYVCRTVCTALIAWPLFYRLTVDEGDAYIFLILVLIAPVAGLTIIANSVFCLFRYRDGKSAATNLAFIAVGSAGFLIAWHYLPMFAMH